MHIHLHLDSRTGQQLSQLAKQFGESHNTPISQAITQWLEQKLYKPVEQENQPSWPEAVANFTGITAMPAFESYRDELTAASEDPLTSYQAASYAKCFFYSGCNSAL